MPTDKKTRLSADSRRKRRRQLNVLMAVVFCWGAAIALGAGLFGRDPESGQATFAPHPLRGLIVLACVATFTLIWWLAARRRDAV